jgi:hypothetical protein
VTKVRGSRSGDWINWHIGYDLSITIDTTLSLITHFTVHLDHRGGKMLYFFMEYSNLVITHFGIKGFSTRKKHHESGTSNWPNAICGLPETIRKLLMKETVSLTLTLQKP